MDRTDSINLLGIRTGITTLIILNALSEQFKLGVINEERYCEFLQDVIDTCAKELDVLREVSQKMQ